MKRHLLLTLMMFSAGVMCISSCSDDEDRPTFPLSAEVFHSVNGTKVAFNALTHSATTWSWDFGDGKTSTEKNPVHVYDEGGYYVAKLTATDVKGNSVTKEVKLALDLPPYSLLVGNHTADGYQGKTWKLSSDHGPLGDYFANADADLSTVAGTPKPLGTGIFGNLGFGNAYTDEFTFHYDGSYSIDPKADGGVFGGLVYQVVMHNGGAEVTVSNTTYGLAIANYTPDDDLTFTFTEEEDVNVPTVYGGRAFNKVMTLDFSKNGFLAFRDFQQKIIVNYISDQRMQVIVFMAAATNPGSLIGVNSHALFLTLEAVN